MTIFSTRSTPPNTAQIHRRIGRWPATWVMLAVMVVTAGCGDSSSPASPDSLLASA